MTKVCHITSVHPRHDVRILYKECISLKKVGYDVVLLVADSYQQEIIEGVTIRTTGFVPKNRLERFFRSRRIMAKAAIYEDAEIYHLHDPELLPLGRKLKRLGKKVIFDSHEDVPSDILDKPWIPAFLRKTASNMYMLYEKVALSKLDAVVSVTPHLTKRLIKLNQNTVQITNYPILITEKERIPVGNSICFAGNIKRDYNHHIILKAIENIEGIKYILAGHGDREYLDELEHMPGWEKVEFLGNISYEEVFDIYSRSLAGISLHMYSANVGGKEGSLGMVKNYEYLMSGLPIIVTDFTVWKEILSEYRCGICVDPTDVDAVEAAIRYLMENPDIADRMGKNGRDAALKKFSWNSQEIVLESLYQSLLDTPEQGARK